MENYIVDNNYYVHLTKDGLQEIFETKTNFKDIIFNITNYQEDDFIFYPFYINDNFNIKMEFNYLNFINDNEFEYNLKVILNIRGVEKEYYQNKFILNKKSDIKIFQQGNTISLYLNNIFLNIIKDERITYGTIAIKSLFGFSFKIISFVGEIPNKELGWTYKQGKSNSFILLNEKSKYVIENFCSFDNSLNNNLLKKSGRIFRSFNPEKEEFINDSTWDIAPFAKKYGLNQEYTISFYIKVYEIGDFRLYLQSGSGSKYILDSKETSVGQIVFNINEKNKWIKKEFTFRLKASPIDYPSAFIAFYGGYDTGKRIRIKNMKLELGNKSTPYSFNSEESETVDLSNISSHVDNIKENTYYTFSKSNNDLITYLNEDEIKEKTISYIPYKENLFRNSYDMSNFSITYSNHSVDYPIESKFLEENGINFVRTKRINLERNNTTFSIYNKIKYENIIPNFKILKNVKISFMARAQQNIKFIVAAKEHDAGIIYPNVHGERIEITTEWKTFSFVFPEFSATKTSLYYIPINPVSYTDILSLKDFYLDIARYKMEYNDGTDMIPNWIPSTEDNVEYNPSLNIKMLNNKNGVKELPYLQLEEGKAATSYIENKDMIQVLDESVFKVPTKNNIDRNAGTLIYKYLPDINQTDYNIFNIGDFNLVYKDNQYILSSETDSIPNKQLSVPFDNVDKETYIIWTWVENNHKLIIIANNKIKFDLNSSGEMNGSFNTMDFAPKNFSKGIIYSLDIYNLDVMYQSETIETYLKYQKDNTQNKIFGLNLNSKIEFFKKPFLESSLVPLDGSPILVRNEDGPMQRQFFFDDETGKYRDFNKEYFTYTGDREIKVAYDHLDKSFNPTVIINSGIYKGQSIGEPVSIVGNNIIKMTIGNEESQSIFGEELEVSYRIKNSYNIEFNEKAANDSYIINLDNPEGKDIIVTQEGDRFNNRKLAKEIELNPILNPRHEGFLYITKNSQKTNSFRIQVSSDMVLADGLDSADILIEAIDEYKNEVLSPYLDVYVIDENGIESTKFGSITPIINYETMKARNTSGRLYLRYNAPYLSTKELNREQKVYIIVYDRKNNIGTQTSLILKPSPGDSKISQLSIPRNGNIPLEYFARYFERNNVPEKVLEVLDYDKNGQLTREDLDVLIQKQYNQSEMIAATETLKSLEEF